MVQELSEKFLARYKEFAKEFDEIAKDSFQGEKLDRLAKSFLVEHHDQLANQPFTWSSSTFPNCTPNEALIEDMRIAACEDMPKEVPERAKVLAGVWRRACQARYLRITFVKSRRDIEENRIEAVELGRRAIRYDPTDFLVFYWFMIALGWHSNTLTSAKEGSVSARTFKQVTERVIQMDPNDPLAYNLLGRYHYSVANLSWLERTVAKNLLGCKLEGTHVEAEKNFLQAHKLKDNWLPSGLWMARVLMALKRPIEEIKEWVDFGLSQECLEPSSELEKKDLLEFQAKLKLIN